MQKNSTTAALSLAALGVVFGDIGTSPLYAFQQCFTGQYHADINAANVIGIVSLIFYGLVIVVSVKYVTFMLRADNDGQGGTLALLAQLSPLRKTGMPMRLGMLSMLVLFGSAMLYGDGTITPAISVISAVEGLDVWTRAAHPYIVPISVAVLLVLFLAQRRGTGGLGSLFGPIMVVWFVCIGALGAFSIVHAPQILWALNPVYSWAFVLHHGLRSLLIFGAVVLCVTGVEALYADLAHFGRKPITWAWYALVFPMLALNYFGQGALALRAPAAIATGTFYALVPHWGIIPMVLLATVATVIASQALISGVYSLTKQAMQLGYAPRFRIVQTSRHHAGQVYMPTVTVMLAIVCIALVVTFRSSNALGGAYGLAVTITMIIDTITFFHLLTQKWRWRGWKAALLTILFLSWDIPFLTGNMSKLFSGGWVPMVIAVILFTLFVTWNRGRRRLMAGLSHYTMPVEEFLREAREPGAGGGTAFFLTPDPHGIPFVKQHQWLRSHIAFDTIVLLTIINGSRPFVHRQDRIAVEQIAPRLLRVKALYGFMQQPNMSDILKQLREVWPHTDFRAPTYYLASPKIRPDDGEGHLPDWQRKLFEWMTRNARPLTDSLGLPPNSVVEFGVEVHV